MRLMVGVINGSVVDYAYSVCVFFSPLWPGQLSASASTVASSSSSPSPSYSLVSRVNSRPHTYFISCWSACTICYVSLQNSCQAQPDVYRAVSIVWFLSEYPLLFIRCCIFPPGEHLASGADLPRRLPVDPVHLPAGHQHLRMEAGWSQPRADL